MMARDAIGIACISAEDQGESLENPSSITDIDVSKGTFADDEARVVLLIDVDLTEYRRRMDNHMIRRNVTLPISAKL
ncbi:MAG: type II toxin-antitoxin system HicB family antitoxin [Clostridiales bacterium]|nr:type II toxin-antitoxin system HicB family antitoxin [Clostridiales bacterium]